MSTFDACVEPDEDGTEFVAEVRCCRRHRLCNLRTVVFKAAESKRKMHSPWLRWAEGIGQVFQAAGLPGCGTCCLWVGSCRLDNGSHYITCGCMHASLMAACLAPAADWVRAADTWHRGSVCAISEGRSGQVRLLEVHLLEVQPVHTLCLRWGATTC